MGSLEDQVRGAVRGKAPGVAVVVVGAEGVRARAAVGLADLIEGIPMTTGMAMPWFSMTKIATATTTMRLAERGVIDLDTPMSRVVPAMSSLRPTEWADRITCRHLLQHSAGLANPIPVRWIHPPDRPGPDPEAFLTGLLGRNSKLRFAPGGRSSYSNLGTLILGELIARRTGLTVEKVVDDEVLDPVGMSASGFVFDSAVPAAVGYHPKRSPMRLLLPRWVQGESSGRWMSLHRFLLDGAAYGGLIGTADDVASFLRTHLRNGDLNGRRLISAAAAETMRRIDMPGRRYDLGLGWFVPVKHRDASPPFVEHLGGGAGFFNVIRLYPTAGVGAVVMGNATRYPIGDVAALALQFRH